MRKIKIVLKFFYKFLYSKYLKISLIVLSIFIVISDLVQYIFTEYLWLVNRIDNKWTTFFLLVLILVFSYRCNNTKKTGIVLRDFILVFFLFIFVLIMHKRYGIFYNNLQRIPRIKLLERNWAIQGDKIAIYGKNFGESQDQGKVFLGNQELLTGSWESEKVIINIPIIEKYDNYELIFINKYGNRQREDIFLEIKNPSDVL